MNITRSWFFGYENVNFVEIKVSKWRWTFRVYLFWFVLYYLRNKENFSCCVMRLYSVFSNKYIVSFGDSMAQPVPLVTNKIFQLCVKCYPVTNRPGFTLFFPSALNLLCIKCTFISTEWNFVMLLPKWHQLNTKSRTTGNGLC